MSFRTASFLLRSGYALASCMLAGALPAATLEERLAELERSVQALKAENAELRTELGHPEKKPASKAVPVITAGKVERLAIGGFIQAQTEFGDPVDARWGSAGDRFFLRRARLGATANLKGDFLARIEAEFGAGSLNAGSGARAQLTDAFVQWGKYSEAVVRMGQFKVPFGYEQLASDTRIPLLERARSSDALTVGRQIGASVQGDLADKRFSYAAGVFNGNGTNTGLNDNDHFLWAGRLAVTPFDGKVGSTKVKASLGTNVFTSEVPGDKRDGYGIDAQLTAGPATLWAEWLANEFRNGDDPSGWSLMGVWQFSPEWNGVVRYETFEIGSIDERLWTFGVNYLILGDDVKLSLNYLLGDRDSSDEASRLIGRMQILF